MFTLLARLFAGQFFKNAAGEIAKGWHWLFSSATHILEALLTVALLFGLWERHEVHVAQGHLAKCQAGRKADQDQWNRQVAAAKAATAIAEQNGKDVAHDAQTYHAQLQADNSRLRQYAAARLVRPGPRPAASPGTGSRDAAAVHADPATVPTVAVPAAVLDTCDADYTYAAGAYRLGQDLIAKGLARP